MKLVVAFLHSFNQISFRNFDILRIRNYNKRQISNSGKWFLCSMFILKFSKFIINQPVSILTLTLIAIMITKVTNFTPENVPSAENIDILFKQNFIQY